MTKNSDNDPVLLATELAIENKQLHELLIGKISVGDLMFNNLIEFPVNVGVLFNRSLNAYALKHGENILNQELHKAFVELLKEPIGCWWGLSLIVEYYFYFKKDALNFVIDVNKLMQSINTSLRENKQMLMNNKSYTGKRFEGGLWEHVQKEVFMINSILEENKIILP